MLDVISRYTSAISLAAVAAFSIFNVGYFWKIGVHFLGIVDLSNLIYSFGLALAVLFLCIQVAAAVTPRKPSVVKALFGSVVGGGFIVAALLGPRHWFPREIMSEALALLGLVITSSVSLAYVRWRHPQNEVWEARELTLVGLAVFATVFQAGIVSAFIEIEAAGTYDVGTKSGVINAAKIIRSSSSGFIIFSGRKVSFIPQSEVKFITSTVEVPQ